MPSDVSKVGNEKDLAGAVEELTRELSDAHRREAATADILKVISRSTFSLQEVLDGLIESAVRLTGAEMGLIYKQDGDFYRAAAIYGASPESIEVTKQNPILPGRQSATGRAVLERRVIHIKDVVEDPEYTWAGQQGVQVRTILAVPMLRENAVVGVIVTRRTRVQPFTDKQIELLTTFADQAVIAIENTRLFHELRESLQQQTATADVLKVISRSTSDLQTVLDTLVESAARLCDADFSFIYQRIGDLFHLVASHGFSGEFIEFQKKNPIPLGRGSLTGRTALECRVVHIPDVLEDPEYTWTKSIELARFRAMLGVPLLREGIPIGVIALLRGTARPFTGKQIELVTTFADQAVIAIENARLFEEVQARTAELQESLEYQTATAEVLGVISRSPTDVQPVFDAIASSAAKLCNALDAVVLRVDGDMLRLVAHHGPMPIGDVPLHCGTVGGRAVIERRLIHVEDLQAEEVEYPEGSEFAKRLGHRTTLSVPLLREGVAIGNIQVRRDEVQPFSEKQIALLQIFADQAVIAIENARLFQEVQARTRELARSVEELESLGKVSQAVNSSLELDKVLPTILENACAMSYAGGGTVYVFDKTTGEFQLAAAHNMSEEHIAMVRAQPMRLNSVVVGECAARRQVVQIADLGRGPPSPLLDVLLRTGVRAILAVPLLHQAEVVGVLVVRRNQAGAFSPEIIRLVEAFAAQSAIAVENARLFGEIAQKSRELEIASQHKNQFVANMSHELRTPLAAILGYAELMQEGFYEPLGEKSLDALTRIRSNGKHLLGLINTVLDIAKIESGQFTLNMAEYAIESVVETVRSATESLAQNKKLTLKSEVAKSLPIGLGDEQRLTQVLLNLVGNAIKFTDAGEVRVTAKAVNGHFNVTVADTGPGIPPAEQSRIFEQFHQVDSSLTKAKSGTGLGLAIAKQIVEMHGGRIWVESTLGKGSTFQMEVPTRAEVRKRAL